MNAFKLARLEHNVERLESIADACTKRINNAATEKDYDICLEHIGICQLLVHVDECIYEYTPFKMFLLKLANKAVKHQQFIDQVDTLFSTLRELVAQRRQLICTNTN